MNLNWFAHIIVHHPYIIVSAVLVFSGTCLIIPFTLKARPFQDFSDPKMGFTTRGTEIANRLTTWKNLVESTRPSGQFAMNPEDYMLERNFSLMPSMRKSQKKDKLSRKQRNNEYPSVVFFTETNRSESSNESNKWRDLKNFIKNSNPPGKMTPKPPIEKDGFFCGSPDERYAHIVLKSEGNIDLFTLRSMLALCRFEHKFVEAKHYKDLCTAINLRGKKQKKRKCCKPWSLANYIAILHNRSDCLGITEEDIEATRKLLISCAPYFHDLTLSADCASKRHCQAPIECIKHDAVYNLLNFIIGISFLPPNNTLSHTVAHETIVFLPLACSTAILPYYHEIEKLDLEYEGISMVAMEFGIKEALFNEYLLRDSWLMSMGAVFVFFCIWLYTESLFLTVMTIIAIIFSLGISYFVYMLVFELQFFPFMNLLVIIVAIGIGSDDAFIFCKIWYTVKQEKNNSVMQIMNETFHHAFFSMFVTSLTTSAAFLASYASSVTAISCFSIFSGTAVITNFMLMVTWFPACVVLWERSCCSNNDFVKSCMLACMQRWCCAKVLKPSWSFCISWPNYSFIGKLWLAKERFLLDAVLNMRYLWFGLFSLAALASAVIVIYYPRLKLPDSSEFQLFDSTHLFEQYDFLYKNHFWFKREERLMQEGVTARLPLRFVWGVLAVDNGDHLNPESFGTLELDPDFDIADPEAQLWLLNFCKKLRAQPFFQPTLGLLLPNCFIETFIKSMKRKCLDEFSYRNHTPCCETSKFPFERAVFTECIVEEMTDIYRTPREYFIPGMAGPKFSKDQFPTINSVIVEYDSTYSYSMSYEYMDEFYASVESWMGGAMAHAPKSMRNGWFVSELDFYDLQKELSRGTLRAIGLSMGLALAVLLLSTLNVLTSLFAVATITCSIFVTVAVLVLLGWRLNILESVAVSTAIGLTMDFSLHYTVSYRLAPAGGRRAATRHALARMAGPALMAALTTGAAGALMLPSLILPYIQIGVFLVTVMSVSWLFATFHLGAQLAIMGPQNRFGQFRYWGCVEGRQGEGGEGAEGHELDSLAIACNKVIGEREATPRPLVRSLSHGAAASSRSGRFVFTDQSPSATSAITIIMADDN